jgi:alkanesulfonate monooxygenase SsuD/methylene tetrahydromethanopterin reductase-like flavin-dependent oxidoreductase (luciferase family)
MRSDYETLGITYDPPHVHVARLIEAARVLKRLFAEEEVIHARTDYRAKATLRPRPLQRPRPPPMIGGGGPRVLTFAAREADIVGLLPQMTASGFVRPESLTADAVERMVGRVQRAAGSQSAWLELNAVVFDAAVTNDPRSATRRIPARFKGPGARPLETPYFLYGTQAELSARLRDQRERLGISYLALPSTAMEELGPVVAELAGNCARTGWRE